ncbi:hypothetical protein B0T16DRAFT_505277 [Cercophora newfieldiana]|uniref:ER-bound oxygenase mpaB/mpaB'/Rubber oxygenase catalytic domain-containing protein n=1 Tax=Cercophora newfieldiana TaxID=92897 RepID=A0AA39YIQ2_9PEZI|nr:hypothetical protein B0T16DRAFT_505277 [Cercophora newfieldiana]
MSSLPTLILSKQSRLPKPSLPSLSTPKQTSPIPPSRLLAIACEDLPTWTGGPYAILLQLASPSIALGSCAHSRFIADPISRFLRTAVFVLAVTHGTPEQTRAVCDVITRQHSHVRGKGYDARDVHLQKWTAATLFVASRRGRMVFGEGMKSVGLRTRGEMEGLCVEWGRLASVLDMPGEMWPGGLDEFEEYWEGEMGRIEREGVEGVSREMGRVLLFGMGLPWWLRWVMVVVRVVVARWLPQGLRRAYGLADPMGWGMWLGYAVVVWILWGANWAMPKFVKRMIARGMVEYMARAVEGIQRTGTWTI